METLTQTIKSEKSCCDTTCCADETTTTIATTTEAGAAIKEMVKEQYTKVALQDKQQNESACCGTSCCSTEPTNFSDDYSNLQGYNPDADLGLGCGLPTEFAKIKEGDVVVDLGSGAGNDAFVARSVTGEKGKVIGIDMTPAMVEKARKNTFKLGLNNVEFLLGDIENIPLPEGVANVVVSNCVMNLVPDKLKAFEETFRILKPGGHFSISDIVLEGELPENLQKAAEMYAGCVSGAIQKTMYLEIIQQVGFTNITLQKEKQIVIPEDILLNYISPAELITYHEKLKGIFSITVYAEKA